MKKNSFSSREVNPDWESFVSCIEYRTKPKRVHFVELFLDAEIEDALCREFDLSAGLKPEDPAFEMQRKIRLHRFLGYDFVRQGVDPFEMRFFRNRAPDTARLSRSAGRSFVDSKIGPIADWQDFEDYPWPDPDSFSTMKLEWYEKNLPDDMCVVGSGGLAHFAEHLIWLMGYEALCFALFDQPELVKAIADRLMEINQAMLSRVLQFECVRVIWGSDDMGFKTGPLLSPAHLRRLVLPGHQLMAEMSHAAGRPYLLHSCGQLSEILEDLIEGVGIDGKHSFEDAIQPVTEFYDEYSSRISVLGGIDVDFLCRAEEQVVRQRVKEVLSRCHAEGGYCLGTGNSVANYIPLRNYLAMLDEGRRFA